MNGDRWDDWRLFEWCPILGAVPALDWMSEATHEGRAASLIHRLRADFFDAACQIGAGNVDEANRIPDPDEATDRIIQARVIYNNARRIEKHALWAMEIWRPTREGEQDMLRLGEVVNEIRGGRRPESMETFEFLFNNGVEDALDMAITSAALHGSPPPFSETAWPIHDSLAVLAIHDAADSLQGLLEDASRWPIKRVLSTLQHAQMLDRIAREYKAAAVAKAEPSRRGKLNRGKPRPAAQSPLRKALAALVKRGLTNGQILQLLTDIDEVSRDAELPIELAETEGESGIRWYPRGGSFERAEMMSKVGLQKALSQIRNARKD